MVLGLKTKTRKSPSVQLDYLINIVEIKPWPPSQSLRSLRAALIQWEHGDKNLGSTKAVAPSLVSASGVGDGKIEFNESFRLHMTLLREMSIKAGDSETFLKNCIEFNMYEPRRDKTVKGQLLATAIVDFAEYGIVKDSLTISVPMNCKRTYGNNAPQPMLTLKIQAVEKGNRVRSLSKDGLLREGSMDRTCAESVSALMNEEYAEEADAASVTTDDDVSSQVSVAGASSTFGSNGSSTSQRENGSNATFGSSGSFKDQEVLIQDKKFSEVLVKEELKTNSINDSHGSMREKILQKASNGGNGSLSNMGESQNGQESQIVGDLESNTSNADRLKKVKHTPYSLDSGYGNGSIRTGKFGEKSKDVNIRNLEHRIKNLEGELREAAAIEVSLYSIVAEHGSSVNKVHAPARRLSRLYLHACKEDSQSRRASSARSIVSGLILVAKACGNDVPRLTFWLSNSVVLRAIIHKTCEEDHKALPPGQFSKKNVRKGNNEIISPLKWKKESSLKESRSGLHGICSDWENPHTFISALEKVENWIFSRIIESVWWQTLTPYMQSAAAKAIIRVVDSESSKACQRTSGSSDLEQANFSLELWKTAFMDACERICPVRAGGHDCGCLPVLSRLVMEQCTARLDVAMFNAVLRESADEVPTDPISDPISDARVLPIPSGKASFGAGAQLKNAIGNWSRWLTDLFGIDDDDSFEDGKEKDAETSCKSFHLLNALSDLMMLPKDMLLSNTIRKEVCPTFGSQLIRRILDTFVPDEFCPDPVPEVVLEALDSEQDSAESGEDCVVSPVWLLQSYITHLLRLP